MNPFVKTQPVFNNKVKTLTYRVNHKMKYKLTEINIYRMLENEFLAELIINDSFVIQMSSDKRFSIPGKDEYWKMQGEQEKAFNELDVHEVLQLVNIDKEDHITMDYLRERCPNFKILL